MTAAQHISKLKSWNSNQSLIRRSLMDSYRGITPITNLELRIKASQLEKEMDRTLLDVAVLVEFNRLYLND